MDTAVGCVGAGFVNAELCGVDDADIGLITLSEVAALLDAVTVGGCARHFADYLLGGDIPAPAELVSVGRIFIRSERRKAAIAGYLGGDALPDERAEEFLAVRPVAEEIIVRIGVNKAGANFIRFWR